MKPRTSPIVLGFIWGILTMMLSFAVFSVFASLKLVFTGFPLFADSEQAQYLLIGAVFLLSVLGAIGAGIMPRLMRLGGLFLLISCIGVAALLFVPVIMQSFSFAPLEAYGIYLTPLVMLIADFSMGALAAIGLLGGILAFIPKKGKKAPTPLAVQTASAPVKTAMPSAMPFVSQPEPVQAAPAVVPAEPEPVQAAPVAVTVADQPEPVQAAPADAQTAGGSDTVSAAPPPNIDLINMD